jgi:amidohydrolase
MDALPLTETADVDYKSTNPGVMHACGHDGHMASLLTAAKVLFHNRSELSGKFMLRCVVNLATIRWIGSVKLIFQPAEEGYAGAREMIKDGCLDATMGPRVDFIYGIHIWACI